MENVLKEKYFLTSVEGGKQEDAKAFMGVVALIASMMEINPWEVFCLEFPGGDRVNIMMMGEASEGTFKRAGNTATATFDDDETIEMSIGDNQITFEKDGTKMFFSDTPPKTENGAAASGQDLSIDLSSLGSMIGELMMGMLGALMDVADVKVEEIEPADDEKKRTKEENDGE